jgi:hypothetical protein
LIFFKLAFGVRYSITALGLWFGNVLKQGILTYQLKGKPQYR